ncbi:hypothetical protein Dtox_2594 [Desulfofarcimen acetoxidans DSM 771]|uniref:Uncharacterized protein n=1 Tax=Desulfofarcimen acetoxidans (strain ATCC 49208 / DSM 771 / KCTC 5769 / VKM B-1644 / 5575) TaxID=485916 RepID=C8W0Z1_DESAS|nr:hypothetical protein [Desulfofarcimen acetoxidans]ACV63387.1 hypothetical protein Dtox_2594 [Desulfofarcimen acetoxidans DSM 771]
MPYQFNCSFHCTEPEKINRITFAIICKSSFIGYLNGKEVVRSDKISTECNYIDLTDYKNNLQVGDNEILIELQQMDFQQIDTQQMNLAQIELRQLPIAGKDHMLFMAELILE